MYTMVVAEKSLKPSRDIVIPIQFNYMQSKDKNWVEIFYGYAVSKSNPPPISSKKENVVIPLLNDQFSFRK